MIKRLSIIAVLLLGLSVAGCASRVGEDEVPRIAQTIQIAAELLTDSGLTLLDQKKPGEVPGAIEDLNSIIAVAVQYSDGKLSVSDVVFTVTTVLDRLNARFSLVEGENTELILSALRSISRIVEIYFVETVLPEEFGIYITAFALGVQDGLDAFNAKQVTARTSSGLGSLGVSGLTGGIPVSTLAGTVMP